MPAAVTQSAVSTSLLPYLAALANPMFLPQRGLLVHSLAAHMVEQAQFEIKKKANYQRVCAEDELRKQKTSRKRPSPTIDR